VLKQSCRGSAHARAGGPGVRVGETNPDAATSALKCGSRRLAKDEWDRAAVWTIRAAGPHHIPRCCVCRDLRGCGLEATMHGAQAQLADAYLAVGAGVEPAHREDLVAREPWDRAKLERFRRALEIVGESTSAV